ncbi:hypothetical protein PanWU01x14_208420 [Parasponia andersonii]|uniref:Uncharacterized protein n=1 Tax=Parasponia andersonii TaxID=3476 RepID=A0A2P5BUX8_PARAD|nr:hypothetical protein PanWU01x14_208420 [Parasponia andersonii]
MRLPIHLDNALPWKFLHFVTFHHFSYCCYSIPFLIRCVYVSHLDVRDRNQRVQLKETSRYVLGYFYAPMILTSTKQCTPYTYIRFNRHNVGITQLIALHVHIDHSCLDKDMRLKWRFHNVGMNHLGESDMG